MNNTNPPHLQFIKKPIYSAMALLSLLGPPNNFDIKESRLLEKNIFNGNNFKENDVQTDFVGVDDQNYESCFVYVVHNDTNVFDLKYTLHFRYGLAIDEKYLNTTKYVAYLMNKKLTNPFEIWKKAGSPVFPNKEIRKNMRKVEVSA